jgi:CheY-like chemotaxis protein
MPDMSGLEFMQRARDQWPDKKFFSVAITGYAAEQDAHAALAARFNAHVSKPISVSRLQSVLENAAVQSKTPAYRLSE